MSEPQNGGGGYGSRWWKWILIYVLVGGAFYALIYFVFLRDGYGG